jgi:hypothetical protein
LTLTPTGEDHISIKIPKGDTFFDRECNGGITMDFKRSLPYSQDYKEIRTPTNALTSWLDAGNIYGLN